MKTSITLSLLVATAFVLLQCSTVKADMVLLKNGDRLTGSIVRME
jgi:hypothetical protein